MIESPVRNGVHIELFILQNMEMCEYFHNSLFIYYLFVCLIRFVVHTHCSLDLEKISVQCCFLLRELTVVLIMAAYS